ncbi:hypothetical protein ACJIZ3_011712 [Penstemon smallii]|uniref:Isopenicillin N synthase-like Fe(2+) 2OG dioxygenase domain-containing protein n=1 Tax=Penstemon smallii TaxID=265156 RepID=A0ABD3UKB0_9LAMI
MPPAAGIGAQGDRIPMVAPAMVKQPQPPMLAELNEAFAKDAIIAWFRGEFAAANAIIDSLCGHLRQLEGGEPAAYQSAFAAIHRRRLNWIPILQMQKYYSIADVTMELKKVVEKKREEECDVDAKKVNEEEVKEKNLESSVVDEDITADESIDSEITDTGSQEVQQSLEDTDICSNHEDCEARHAKIKTIKGFVAKEPLKGHMVNVVKGLKLYENIFSDVELSKLNDFVNELRVAGQNGDLLGKTFVLYNQQMKGNKRELIQLGVPIFKRIGEDTTDQLQKNYIEPIPALLEGVIEHLIRWHLISENKRPNSCIINFFDEGEYSQPFLKPPHLDQPLSTLLLSESTMAFGRTLMSDNEGNYRGPLMLSLKKGSLLVMRGNSSDTARHVMCSSENKRVSLTFFRVRRETENQIAHSGKAMTLWQPSVPSPYITTPNSYAQMNMIPKWGLMRAPVVMLAPARPMVVNPRRMTRNGTGVFLPWTVGSRRPAKHLPPRAQRRRFFALQSPVEKHKTERISDSGANSP